MSAQDPFRFFQDTPDAPCENGEAVTPHDENELAVVSRALYVGTGGDLVVALASGTTLTLPNVQDGSLLPVRVRRVNATGTTATGIVSLY